jgi:hypothetical protein
VIGARTIMAVLVLAGTPGCAYVTATQNSTPSVHGDLWYVKQRALFGLVFSSRVFHCAPATSGPSKCKEATIAKGASLTDLATSTVSDTATAADKGADDAKSEKDSAKGAGDKDKEKKKEKKK